MAENSAQYFYLLCFLQSFCVIIGLPAQKQGIPICASYKELCDITFEIIEGVYHDTSSSRICTCQNHAVCPVAIDDPWRVVYQEMTASNQKIITRLSYCANTSTSMRMCNKYEAAVTLRANGPVAVELVGGVACKCHVPLVLHTGTADGDYSLREYTCEMPTCDMNKSNPPVCERFRMDSITQSEIICQCPNGFKCNSDVYQSASTLLGNSYEFVCDPFA